MTKKKLGSSYITIDKVKLIKTNKDDGEVYNYDILSLTNENLTLMYLDKGNIANLSRQIMPAEVNE